MNKLKSQFTLKNIFIAGALVITLLTIRPYLTAHFINKNNFTEIKPITATFIKKISTSGAVSSKNRIIVNAPISGRIDQILVEDGTVVKKNQVLAWMSSQDRAAVINSGAGSSINSKSKLQQMYKPTPIVATEAGTIISKNLSQGQNVSVETTLFEISDELVFIGKIDETDLGQISLNQLAEVKAYAFPEVSLKADVYHIVHQGKLNNNITTYDVYLKPHHVMPENFRSGMSVNIEFIILKKDNALLLPSYLAGGLQNSKIELLVRSEERTAENRTVSIGSSNGEFVEVLDGLSATDTVLFLLTNKNDVADKKPQSLLGGK